jgi:hypothetical protein
MPSFAQGISEDIRAVAPFDKLRAGRSGTGVEVWKSAAARDAKRALR